MRFNLQTASFVAMAATIMTATVSTSGSSAAAQELAPGLIQAQSSSPMVPAIDTVAAPDAMSDQSEVPTTLAALVDAQAQPEALSPQMKCLAGAIYFEAKGESLAGQLAVGRVIVNRAKSGRFPGSYCGVVFQPSQFSFIRGKAMPAIATASRGWQRAVAIAQIAENGSWKTSSEGALFFHAARVSPSWHMTRIAQVDDHVFYR